MQSYDLVFHVFAMREAVYLAGRPPCGHDAALDIGRNPLLPFPTGEHIVQPRHAATPHAVDGGRDGASILSNRPDAGNGLRPRLIRDVRGHDDALVVDRNVFEYPSTRDPVEKVEFDL